MCDLLFYTRTNTFSSPPLTHAHIHTLKHAQKDKITRERGTRDTQNTRTRPRRGRATPIIKLKGVGGVSLRPGAGELWPIRHTWTTAALPCLTLSPPPSSFSSYSCAHPSLLPSHLLHTCVILWQGSKSNTQVLLNSFRRRENLYHSHPPSSPSSWLCWMTEAFYLQCVGVCVKIYLWISLDFATSFVIKILYRYGWGFPFPGGLQ